jgi:hypothetical protein
MLEYVVEYLKGTEITDENIAELQVRPPPPPLFSSTSLLLLLPSPPLLSFPHLLKFIYQAAVDARTASLLPPLFTGLYYIIRAAIRTKVTPENFQADLAEIKFPPVFAQDLGKVLNKRYWEREKRMTL